MPKKFNAKAIMLSRRGDQEFEGGYDDWETEFFNSLDGKGLTNRGYIEAILIITHRVQSILLDELKEGEGLDEPHDDNK